MYGINAEQAFLQSFGDTDIQDGEMYYDGGFGLDKRNEMMKRIEAVRLEKAPSFVAGATDAAGTGGAGTASSAFSPVYVDPDVVDLTRKQTPLVELIPRRAVRGKTVDFNQLTTKAGAKWKLEDGGMDEDIDTYDRQSKQVKFAYAVGRISGPAIMTSRHFIDVRALDVRVKTIEIRELEEQTILNGDATTYSTEYDGMISSITNNSRSLSANEVTLGDIRTENDTIFEDSGNNNLNVMQATTHSYMKGLLMDFQRYVDKSTDLPFGISGAFSIDGVNHIKSRFLTGADSSREFLCLTRESWEMGTLLDATFEELAKTNDSNKFMIKLYEVLVNKADKFNSQLTSVS